MRYRLVWCERGTYDLNPGPWYDSSDGELERLRAFAEKMNRDVPAHRYWVEERD